MDLSLRQSYDKGTITYEEVWHDLSEVYHITNIYNDWEANEGGYLGGIEISKALADDYNYRRCNYKSYIRRGMNARLLMELRISAMIPMDNQGFYQMFDTCTTYKEVKDKRIKYFREVLNITWWEDWGWQLWYLLKHNLSNEQSVDLELDYSNCFKDWDEKPVKTSEVYKEQWFNAHVPEHVQSAMGYRD